MEGKRETRRTTATLLPIWKPRFLYSSLARTDSSVGSATMVPEASMPRIWGKDLMGYSPFLKARHLESHRARG